MMLSGSFNFGWNGLRRSDWSSYSCTRRNKRRFHEKEEVKNAVYGHSGLVVFNDEYLKMSGVIDAMQHFVADAENPGVIDPDNPYTPGDTSTGLYLAFTGQD